MGEVSSRSVRRTSRLTHSRVPCFALALACLTACSIVAERSARVRPPADDAGAPRGEWRVYAADTYGSRYAPLDQIDRDNFQNLRVAWQWWSIDNDLQRLRPDLHPGPNEATPLLVDGVLYTSTSLNQVAALDPESGKLLWSYDPGSHGGVHRGLAYWEGKREGGERDRRLLLATRDSYLIAIDADTGKPIPSFGTNGRVDLFESLRRRPTDRKLLSQTSPPIVCRGVIVTGGAIFDWHDQREMPPGDVRGFDVRTGKRVWTFHTVPQQGEVGSETWEDGSSSYTGNTNVWTPMSCDPELGYVYLPVSTPTNDHYGGHRPGANLFGESLVCLDAETGERVWHYQIVHHGLWDYDPPAAPNLVDVTVDGERVEAVAQVTKQGFCFVFDRRTGRPLWPIEERPVPRSTMPGEKSWPTQPFPAKPAPFDRQGASEDDLIDWTPELRSEARRILERWVHGPLYTPPTQQATILLPGRLGGASWAGAAHDPGTGILYVSSVTRPTWLALAEPASPDATVAYMIDANGYEVAGPRGLPLFKGPYGRITAIDLNTGEHRWMTPLGDGPRRHPAIRHFALPRLGHDQRGFLLLTKTLLFAIQEGSPDNGEPPQEPPLLRVFDKRTGAPLGELRVPGHATGAPITYLADGRQYFVYPTGGGIEPARLVALALP